MADFPSTANIEYHLPVQTPYCMLCRYRINFFEAIAAVIGHWGSPTYLAHTLAFPFSPPDYGPDYVTAYERSTSTSHQWLLCHSSDCDVCQELQDASIYHIDCFHAVQKNSALKSASISNLWTIASWTESLPKARYQAPPNAITGVVDAQIFIEEHGSIFTFISGLPQELRDTIVQLSPESAAWRFMSARNRWRIFQPLLDSQIEIKGLWFGNVRSWCRNKGLAAGSGNGGKIRIKLDDLGISELNYVDDSLPLTPVASAAQNAWYVVEDVSEMREARIEVKGYFMRIRKLRSFHLWDTPTPPDQALTFWNRETAVNKRVRSIPLEGITGLTVYCEQGRVLWIHAHRDESFHHPFPNDTSAPVQDIQKLDDHYMTPIFFPFSKGERINAIWVRSSESINGHFPVPDALAIITTTGRFQIFGTYLSPDRPDVHYKQLSGNSTATHLLIQDLDFPLPMISHFAAVSASVHNTDTPPALPGQLSQLRDGIDMYVSIVSFQNIKKIWLFRRQTPEGIPKTERPCMGMTLEYDDGAVAAAGICRQTFDNAVELVESPISIHYRFCPEANAFAVECATREVRRDDILGGDHGWECVNLPCQWWELRWWFNDGSYQWITWGHRGTDSAGSGSL